MSQNTQTDKELAVSSAMIDVARDDVFARAVHGCNWVERVSDIHKGMLAYVSQSMGPALGELALHLRSAGSLSLEGGFTLTADPLSPRHRTDILVSHPDKSRCHHVFICHRPKESELGRRTKAERCASMSSDDIIAKVINPSSWSKAFNANPEMWLDPVPGDFVELIGATWLKMKPKDGFASFRPPKETPDIWWADQSLNLKPNFFVWLDGISQLQISSRRSSNDPYEELRLIDVLGQAVKAAGLGGSVQEINGNLESAKWGQFGDDDSAASYSAGLRLVRDEGGYVTQDSIDAISNIERQVYAKLVMKSVDALRALADRLIEAGHSNPQTEVDFDDLRNCVWAERMEDSTWMRLRNGSGRFCMELKDDGAVKVYRGHVNPDLIEALVPGAEGLVPADLETHQQPSISRVRDRNGVLLSLQSIAHQFSVDPSPEP